MVDFAKIREQSKAKAEALKDQPTRIIPTPPSQLARIKHQLEHHQEEMTDWEYDWCMNNKNYLTLNPDSFLSKRSRAVLETMEQTYCGAMCHALDKAGVPHG